MSSGPDLSAPGAFVNLDSADVINLVSDNRELTIILRQLRAVVLMWQSTGQLRHPFGPSMLELLREIEKRVGPPSEYPHSPGEGGGC